jgi:hypothetical protein
VDNIEMDFIDIGGAGMDWIGLAQDRDKWRADVECHNEPFALHKMLGGYRVAA